MTNTYERKVDTLANGGVVLEERPLNPKGHGLERCTVVLCYLPESHDRYAVWTHVHPEERPSYCVDGSYTSDLNKALDDYESR